MRWLLFWRHPALLRRVIVNQTSDTSVSMQGVLFQSRGPWIVLRESSLLKAGIPPIPMEGEVLIHRDQIAFVQVLP